MITGLILIDLQNIFDTIDHDVLLQNLYAIYLSRHTVHWFKSYLFNRQFLLNLGDTFSHPASASCSVTQVSIMGSLLSLIYVNNMSQAVKCYLFLYANNSCPACEHKSIKDIINPYHCFLENVNLNKQFIVVLDGIICFSVRFWDNSLLVLKMRFQVFSLASKKVQGFSSDRNILILLLSVLFHCTKNEIFH